MRKRRISGRAMAKVLTEHFGFVFIKQKGSHMKFRAPRGGRVVTTIVPDHKELDYGTIRGILRLAEIMEEDFWKAF